jgi:hypothetical protein
MSATPIPAADVARELWDALCRDVSPEEALALIQALDRLLNPDPPED